jgi:hypothetical protein
MARHGHRAALRRVMEMPVTTPLPHLSPTVAFDQLDDLAHLHTHLSDDSGRSGTVGARA